MPMMKIIAVFKIVGNNIIIGRKKYE